MEDYLFEWKTLVDRSVNITAKTKEKAYKKWIDGKFENPDIDNEEEIGETVEIDQEEYYTDRFEKVKYSDWEQ